VHVADLSEGGGRGESEGEGDERELHGVRVTLLSTCWLTRLGLLIESRKFNSQTGLHTYGTRLCSTAEAATG
jgi:hypothetical protein